MKIGFTGTRHGMTISQMSSFETLMKERTCDEFHHGGCIGADNNAHTICKRLKNKIVIHPPINKKAVFNYEDADVILPEKEYLKRNKDIVNSTGLLIATPFGNEEAHSGTWSTIRYAIKVGKPVLIIYPNGICETKEHERKIK